MARIRTIKPEFFTSLTVTKLPIAARLTFIGLWTYVDDEGRGRDEPRLIKAALWPLDDNRPAEAVESDLAQLAGAGLIDRYLAHGESYLQVRHFREHQYIQKPKTSQYPPMTERRSPTVAIPEPSGTSTVVVPAGKERKGKERNVVPAAGAAWVNEPVTIYGAHIGLVGHGQMGAALKPACLAYTPEAGNAAAGWAVIKPWFEAYCSLRPFQKPSGSFPRNPDEAEKNTRFCSPADFVKNIAFWRELVDTPEAA